jgi:hypothetical protein
MRKFINLIESAMAGTVAEALDPMRTIAPGTKKTKKVKLKDGRVAVLTIEYTDAHEKRPYDQVQVVATIDGQEAAFADFSQNRVGDEPWDARFKGTWSANNLRTYENFRRLGLATEMYAFATSCGMRIVRSGLYGGKLLPDGASFWNKQRPPWKLGSKPKPAPDYWRRPKKT